MSINLKNISLLLTYLLPIALISGPAIPDIIIVCISLLFLINSVLEKDFNWLSLKFFKIFTIFWILLIIISFFSFNKLNSFTESLIFIRFFIFTIAIFYWIIDDFSKVLDLIFNGNLLLIFIIVFHPIESIFIAKIFTNSFLNVFPFFENRKSIV